MTLQIFYSIAGDKCCAVDVSINVSVASDEAYATQPGSSIAVTHRYMKF